jgi:hypothetical protein
MHAHEMQTLYPKIFGRIPDFIAALLIYYSTSIFQQKNGLCVMFNLPEFNSSLAAFSASKAGQTSQYHMGPYPHFPFIYRSFPVQYLLNPALQSVILPVYFQIHCISTYMCPRSTPSYTVTNLNR